MSQNIQNPTLAGDQDAQRDEFINRLLQSTGGVFDIFTIFIGDRLGFYQALAAGMPLNSTELANQTGTQERYVREWLEQQTVTGILEVENAEKRPKERRFSLPAAHAEVLASPDSENYLAPLALAVVGAVRPIESLLEAYQNGGGVSYDQYGSVFIEGQAGMNRALFLNQLGQDWLPRIPDVHQRLVADPPARVADIGCGAGWSSIGMIRSYPKITVDGFDLDEPSIEMARINARKAGIDGNLNFHVRDAGDMDLSGKYDLVTAFECIHDMSNPVDVLRSMRRMLNGSGVVIVVDERVGEEFTSTGNDVEWIMYGWSVLHCLPVGLAENPSVGTGTVMREKTLRRYAQEAGFSDLQVLPIENYFFRVYRLML